MSIPPGTDTEKSSMGGGGTLIKWNSPIGAAQVALFPVPRQLGGDWGQRSISVAVWIHLGPGGGPPPFVMTI